MNRFKENILSGIIKGYYNLKMENTEFKLALIHRDVEEIKSFIFPTEYYDIPGVKEFSDLAAVRKFVYNKLEPYRSQHVHLYINGGMAIELLSVIQVAADLEIDLSVFHRDSVSSDYYEQPVTWTPQKSDATLSEATFVLCAGRHTGISGQCIFDQVPSERIFDFSWQEEHARKVLNTCGAYKLQIYLTGLKPLFISVLNAAYNLGMCVTWLHYNYDTEEYFSQPMDVNVIKGGK